jgi:hypothetical protein
MADPWDAGDVSEIKYRLLPSQRVMYVVLGGIWIALGVVQLIAIRHTLPFGLLVGFVLVSYYFLFARFGADLTPSGLTLHGIRTRRIPWHDIADVQLGSILGSEVVKVRLRTGRTRRLRAPLTGFAQADPEFREKAATIRHWWLHYTGQLTA